MVTRLQRLTAPKPPVADYDTFVVHTEPVQLADGHPLRGNHCLLCGGLIGGQAVVFVTVVIATEPGCPCGTVPSPTQLIHAWHRWTSREEIVKAMARLADAAHPEGATSCMS